MIHCVCCFFVFYPPYKSQKFGHSKIVVIILKLKQYGLTTEQFVQKMNCLPSSVCRIVTVHHMFKMNKGFLVEVLYESAHVKKGSHNLGSGELVVLLESWLFPHIMYRARRSFRQRLVLMGVLNITNSAMLLKGPNLLHYKDKLAFLKRLQLHNIAIESLCGNFNIHIWTFSGYFSNKFGSE